MKPRPGRRLISLANAADELGLPYHTLYELHKCGRLPSFTLPGSRSIYLDRRDLDTAIESWKEAAR